MYCKTEFFSFFCPLFQCLYLLCFFFEPHPPRHFSISANYQQVYSITDPSWSNYNTLLHVPLIPFPIILSVSLPLSFFWLSPLSLTLSPSNTFWLTNLENWDLKDGAAGSLDTRLPLSVKWRHSSGTGRQESTLSTFLHMWVRVGPPFCLLVFTGVI